MRPRPDGAGTRAKSRHRREIQIFEDSGIVPDETCSAGLAAKVQAVRNADVCDRAAHNTTETKRETANVNATMRRSAAFQKREVAAFVGAEHFLRIELR